jgi:anti-anti-sigma regulatory factor
VEVALTGDLGIVHVEMLAECADRICGMPARSIRFELGGLAAVDEAGARTLAAACHCLRLHGRQVEVRGMGQEVRQVVTRLGLALPEMTRP